MKHKLLALFLIVSCLLVETEARSKGNVRYSNRPPPMKPADITPPQWMMDSAGMVDNLFDWMGYHEIPHFFRYAIVLAIMLFPFWTVFFIYCCVHNDEYEDEVEEMEFKQRAKKAYERKVKRLEMAKRIKFD